ncbi:MAG: hypothetical protein MZV49_20125 [Rhodopseudomonas palustris]|nr:hypothetical protein [Rhodopseudomonas palustris]
MLATASVASAGPWRADQGNTRGWDLMSLEERIAHQARVRGFTDYQARLAYRTEHHQLMQQRAAARGLTPAGVRERNFAIASSRSRTSRMMRAAPPARSAAPAIDPTADAGGAAGLCLVGVSE